MPRQITALVATTELEAVNQMLSAIGESPITDLATAADENVLIEQAVNHLRHASREVLTEGWRFNKEFGFEIAPAGELAWVGRDGTTATLNIFKPTADLLAFEISKSAAQQGALYPDVTLRKSRKYVETLLPVLVFYDRANNRDGLDQASYPYLYVDGVFAVDFEDMPEVARRYITVLAARRFIQQQLGSSELAGFALADEFKALKNLREEEGEDDDYNILNQADVHRIYGNRRRGASGIYDPRNTTGTV